MSVVRDRISVIIPTKGERGAALLVAIRSVDRQVGDFEIEIVIADDSAAGLGSYEAEMRRAAGNREICIIQTSKEVGLARQFGVNASTGNWIAFLDDDDEWDPNKLACQLDFARLIRDRGQEPVISCRLRYHFSENGRIIGGVPTRLIGNESVSNYLFIKRPAHVGRPSIYTSTIFTSAYVAKAVPWRRVPRHQDWDWLLRAQCIQGVSIAQCSEELVTINVGSEGSISGTSDWMSSLEWAIQTLKTMRNGQVYADFLVAQPLRYALQARQFAGVQAVFAELLLAKSLPSFRAILTGITGLVSRKMVVRIMSLSNFWHSRPTAKGN